MLDVYQKSLFDTIYHEHLDYHTVKPLHSFFERNGMEMVEAVRVHTHGGSLRGIVQTAYGGLEMGPSIAELIAMESELGLDRPQTFKLFVGNINKLKTKLGSLLSELKGEGRKIAGFGAPAKATTLMYHFEISADILDFIVDDSPLKQGLYSPGHHIPVLPPSAIYERKPDYLLLLAWNFAEPIIAKHRAFTEAGGHFIIPLPQVEIR